MCSVAASLMKQCNQRLTLGDAIYNTDPSNERVSNMKQNYSNRGRYKDYHIRDAWRPLGGVTR